MNFYLIAAVAALGGLLFGYDTGVISGALLFIRQVMSLSATLQGVVVAIALAGAAIGAAVAGQLSDRVGRRRVILGAGLLFIAGALISAVAQGVSILLIGRFLVGLAIGVASMLTPLYLAEISPARDRGAIVSLNQLCNTWLVSLLPVQWGDGAGCSHLEQCPASSFQRACWSFRRVHDGSQATAAQVMLRSSSNACAAATTSKTS
jgi:MFS family permease